MEVTLHIELAVNIYSGAVASLACLLEAACAYREELISGEILPCTACLFLVLAS